MFVTDRPEALNVERDSHGVATPSAATSFPGGCVSSIDKFSRNIRGCQHAAAIFTCSVGRYHSSVSSRYCPHPFLLLVAISGSVKHSVMLAGWAWCSGSVAGKCCCRVLLPHLSPVVIDSIDCIDGTVVIAAHPRARGVALPAVWAGVDSGA